MKKSHMITTAEARLVMIIRRTRDIMINADINGYFPLFCIENESRSKAEEARELERAEGRKKDCRPLEPQIVMQISQEEETLVNALRIIQAHRPQGNILDHLTRRYFYTAMELCIFKAGVDRNAYAKADLSYMNLDIEQ